MKKGLLFICLSFVSTILLAQESKDSIIRSLENLERESALKGDSLALFNKLWSPDMVLNAPNNRAGTVEGSNMQLRTGI